MGPIYRRIPGPWIRFGDVWTPEPLRELRRLTDTSHTRFFPVLVGRSRVHLEAGPAPVGPTLRSAPFGDRGRADGRRPWSFLVLGDVECTVEAFFGGDQRCGMVWSLWNTVDICPRNRKGQGLRCLLLFFFRNGLQPTHHHPLLLVIYPNQRCVNILLNVSEESTQDLPWNK